MTKTNGVIPLKENKRNKERTIFAEKHASMLEDLAGLVVEAVNGLYKESKHDILKNGHFNSSIFNPRKMFSHHGLSIMRLFTQIAGNMTREEFTKLFTQMAERIYDEVNETDQFDN